MKAWALHRMSDDEPNQQTTILVVEVGRFMPDVVYGLRVGSPRRWWVSVKVGKYRSARRPLLDVHVHSYVLGRCWSFNTFDGFGRRRWRPDAERPVLRVERVS